MNHRTQQDYHQRILRVLVHIQQHLDDTLPLETLADIAHFSPYHFHRVFRGMVGETVKDHVRRLRLERAAQRLKFTNEPVTRLAFEAGYESHEAFTRAFAAMFGEPPSRFREAHRAITYPDAPSNVHYDATGGVGAFHPVQTGDQSMDVRIETVKPFSVAFIRHVGPYNKVSATWQKLMTWAGPKGLFGPSTACLGVCHDDPEVTPPDKIRYDACLTIDRPVEPEGEIGVQTIGGGDYAVTTHAGPYEKLAETYATLCGQAVPAHGRELRAGPSLEFYRNNPRDTAPEDLRTDIYVPVEPI